MSLPVDTAVASCAEILRSCGSPEDALNLIRGAMGLKTTLGDELTLQFVNMIFKIGSSQFEQLVKSPDLEGAYRSIYTPSHISSRQTPAILEGANNLLPDSGPSDSGARATGSTADLCDCPPRKTPYKTVRGLREHLMIKHSLSQTDAEAEAKIVFSHLQAGNQNRARYESQSFSPGQSYTNEDWSAQYEEYGLNGVAPDQIALPNWNMRA